MVALADAMDVEPLVGVMVTVNVSAASAPSLLQTNNTISAVRLAPTETVPLDPVAFEKSTAPVQAVEPP